MRLDENSLICLVHAYSFLLTPNNCWQEYGPVLFHLLVKAEENVHISHTTTGSTSRFLVCASKGLETPFLSAPTYETYVLTICLAKNIRVLITPSMTIQKSDSRLQKPGKETKCYQSLPNSKKSKQEHHTEENTQH